MLNGGIGGGLPDNPSGEELRANNVFYSLIRLDWKEVIEFVTDISNFSDPGKTYPNETIILTATFYESFYFYGSCTYMTEIVRLGLHITHIF